MYILNLDYVEWHNIKGRNAYKSKIAKLAMNCG